ncbi:MAG TPA: hypothetical protein VJU81_02250 [Methylomirabilota bacterium]|nr:hypothetical protein [Methylomirabilota bacterium]
MRDRSVTVTNPAIGEPRPLPYCAYPGAADLAQHGVQRLPASLPLVDFERARPHRSLRYTAVSASRLTPAQVLRLAEVVAASFAQREPQCRHLRPATLPPAGLEDALHRDPFGVSAFGRWSPERLLYWFIRLLVFTDASSPRSAIEVHTDALAQSLAILDGSGEIIGGAINETMPLLDTPPRIRRGDPFLDAVFAFVEPVVELLGAQEVEATKALSVAYPAFRDAHPAGKVGHHFMVARSDALPTADAFELVAATAARYQALGHAFMVIEATNQWTGAACEVLGATRIHFAPFRLQRMVRPSATPLADTVTSPDGYLSSKDSGSMLYVIRLV